MIEKLKRQAAERIKINNGLQSIPFAKGGNVKSAGMMVGYSSCLAPFLFDHPLAMELAAKIS